MFRCPTRRGRPARLGTVLLPLLLVGAASTARAAQVEAKADAKAAPAWRGSQLIYRNAVTAVSLDQSTDLTYDPTYEMTLALQPRWYVWDQLYVRAGASLSRELTESDWTTQSGEWIVGDTTLGFGSSQLWRVPVVETVFTADLGVRLPTSKASRARTLLLAVEPRVGVSRTFDVLDGLTVAYGLVIARDFHDFTTGELTEPLVPGCVGGDTACDRFRNSGVRNTRARMSNSLSVSLGVLDWLAVGAGAGIHTHWLHDTSRIEGASFAVEPDTSTRHYLNYDLEATFLPVGGFSIGLGASTFNPQQQADSSDQDVFFNRFTELFIDLRFEAAGLASLGD